MLKKRSPVLDDVPDRGCHFGGGGSSGGGTSTTINKNEPPAWMQPYHQDIGNMGQYQSRQPMSFFPGQTFANLAPETQAALQFQTNRALQGSPLTGAAQGELTKTLSGDYLNAGNPAFSGMMDRVSAEIRPRLDAQFAGSGRYGSGAHANAMASALTDAGSQLAYQDYGRERDNMMRGMLFAPQLAQQDYYDASKLAEVGGVREDFAQQGINDQMARHDFSQQEPWNRLGLYSGIINGINAGGTSTGTSTQPRRSLGMGDALGGAAGLAGILGMTGAFGPAGWMFSDARVKEDIKRVGETDEGLGVFTYRYAGDPTGTHHMGVMAQEVEQVHPEAVADVGGVKAVHYGLLGMLGGK
jgi:hypothetical protein